MGLFLLILESVTMDARSLIMVCIGTTLRVLECLEPCETWTEALSESLS